MRLKAIYYRLLGYKTIKELMAEITAGKRLRINEKEIIRGRLLGEALLPRGLYFPKKGETWEPIEDVEIHFMTAHHTAFTGGGNAILPRGEQVVCSSQTKIPCIGAYFRPVHYDQLHALIVPKEEQSNPYYNGYYFSIDTEELNKHFRLVKESEFPLEERGK